jgi:hypothetical protein
MKVKDAMHKACGALRRLQIIPRPECRGKSLGKLDGGGAMSASDPKRHLSSITNAAYGG